MEEQHSPDAKRAMQCANGCLVQYSHLDDCEQCKGKDPCVCHYLHEYPTIIRFNNLAMAKIKTAADWLADYKRFDNRARYGREIDTGEAIELLEAARDVMDILEEIKACDECRYQPCRDHDTI